MKKKALFIVLILSVSAGLTLCADDLEPSDSEILALVKEQNSDALIDYLRASSSHDDKQQRRLRVIFLAAAQGTPEMMQYLEDGLNVNLPRKGRNALYVAAQHDNADVVRFLVEEKGFNPDKTTDLEDIDLHPDFQNPPPADPVCPVLESKKTKTKTPVEEGRRNTPLEEAIYRHNTSALQAFHDSGYSWMDDEILLQTVLENAVNSQKQDFVQYVSSQLLNKTVEADSDTVQKIYANLFVLAVRSNQTNEMDRVLATYTPHAEYIDPDALRHTLSHYSTPTTLEHLLNTHKLSLDIQLVDQAIQHNNLQLSTHLVKKRCVDIDQPTASGRTLLHQAAENSTVQTVEYLINLGADPRIQPKNRNIFIAALKNETVLWYLIKKYFPDSEKRIRDAYADVQGAKRYLDYAETLLYEADEATNLGDWGAAKKKVDEAKKELSSSEGYLWTSLMRLRFKADS